MKNEYLLNVYNAIKEKDNYEIVYDRKEAIKKAILEMHSNDIILILGKGHEDYQILAHETIHFDDREKVREIFIGNNLW